jgi:hypothetical protein
MAPEIHRQSIIEKADCYFHRIINRIALTWIKRMSCGHCLLPIVVTEERLMGKRGACRPFQV